MNTSVVIAVAVCVIALVEVIRLFGPYRRP